ncbi:hypothetical protein ACNQFZ_03985 [Schinkia sp. CFF1]
MSQLSITLLILFTIILIIGFVQTIRLGQAQADNRQNGLDSSISAVVKESPYARNPVFWAYIVGLALILAYIVYHIV